MRRHPVLEAPAAWGSAVVVKRFLPQPPGRRAAMGYARERVGLAQLAGAPQLLWSDDATRTVVMEDLGADAPTLADVLLADRGLRSTDDTSATAYWQSIGWAGALGRTVRRAADLPTEAREALGEAVTEDRRVRHGYPRAGLARMREIAGIRHQEAATAEILDAVGWLEQDTVRHVLGPGDTCPDNALITDDGVRFLDLEGAGVRHVAYEAAYAAEPFSTCWCVFTPPGGLTGAMLDAFTVGAQHSLPGLADDPAWPRQVRAAVAAWVLSGSLWLLDGATADRAMAPAGRAGPHFRALLLARWRWVVRECARDLPDVAAACDEAITWGLRSWRDGSPLDLPGYPAFRSHAGPTKTG